MQFIRIVRRQSGRGSRIVFITRLSMRCPFPCCQRCGRRRVPVGSLLYRCCRPTPGSGIAALLARASLGFFTSGCRWRRCWWCW
eukprot:scaffold7334_cov352-Pinguiococcus_pyrenoidosus.AAC.1